MGWVGSGQVVDTICEFLVWPLFSMVYPTCASIWAIESNSTSDIRKLARYWVLFSLGSLFELLCAKLLQWIPFWPYLKLLVICWLVIPYFDGASHVYKLLVDGCCSIGPRVVNKWLVKWKESLHQTSGDFLVAAESYIKENGTEALEKLIVGKSECKEQNLAMKEIKAVLTATERRVVPVVEWAELVEPHLNCKGIEPVVDTEENQAFAKVQCAESNLPPENESVSTESDKETATGTAVTGSELPEVLIPEVQKEWTCALCLVTTQSEITLKDHLKGRRHKDNMMELKARMRAGKNKAPVPPVTKKTDHPKAGGANGQHKQNTTGRSPRKQPSALWCGLCNIRCSSSNNMADHLKGARHLARLQELAGSLGK